MRLAPKGTRRSSATKIRRRIKGTVRGNSRLSSQRRLPKTGQ